MPRMPINGRQIRASQACRIRLCRFPRSHQRCHNRALWQRRSRASWLRRNRASLPHHNQVSSPRRNRALSPRHNQVLWGRTGNQETHPPIQGFLHHHSQRSQLQIPCSMTATCRASSRDMAHRNRQGQPQPHIQRHSLEGDLDRPRNGGSQISQHNRQRSPLLERHLCSGLCLLSNNRDRWFFHLPHKCLATSRMVRATMQVPPPLPPVRPTPACRDHLNIAVAPSNSKWDHPPPRQHRSCRPVGWNRKALHLVRDANGANSAG